jgi:hypothetical protein
MSSLKDPDEQHKEILIQHLRNPKKGGIIRLSYLNIANIPYFPKGGLIHLELTCLRNITNLPVLPPYLQTLAITMMPNLVSLPELPDTLYKLTVVDTPIKELPTLPEWLVQLMLIGTQVTELTNLPTHLQYLSCGQNRLLKSIETIPETVTELNCCSSPIEVLPILPPVLKILNCEQTRLKTLPPLPSTLQSLCASESLLEELPDLPPDLRQLQVSNTPLRSIPRLPDSLRTFNCEKTLLTRYRHMLGDRLNLLSCDTGFLNDLYELPPNLNLLEVYDYVKNSIVITKSYFELTGFIAEWNAESFKKRCMERCLKVKEELIAEFWKPSRVAALIERDGWDVLDTY